jgi:hypothetical protein
MASIRIKATTLITPLNNMVANTGTARIDEYFFQTNDIAVDDVMEQAFAKKLIINMTFLYGNIYKFSFVQLLT